MSRVYRAGTRRELQALDAQIIEVLRADNPQSVRHVFYRMTDPRLAVPVEKSEKGYRHVQARCVALRRNGAIPYAWIADMSRQGYFVNTFSGAGDFLLRMRGLYRSDVWQDANRACEVWTESRSIASVLIADCRELAVDLFPCGGFSSLSFAYDSAKLRNASNDDRPLTVFYVGDFDPAGVLIDVALERELRRHLSPRIELDFVRAAINREQIAEYDLPEKQRKASDRRSLQITGTVEAEAMPAHVLRKLVRERIEALLPAGALHVARTAEQSEREHIARMARLLGAA